VVGIVTPVVLGVGIFAFWWLKKKNPGVDHSGQEWDDADDEISPLDIDDTGVTREESVNKAVNF
jgi:hypothetical protein